MKEERIRKNEEENLDKQRNRLSPGIHETRKKRVQGKGRIVH